ncbi:NAD/NADP octopine/nopaline dehydrogenase [Verticiella sediminum]|uniref:2-dehydropantoate 2-reductase n=1 Tax=Verticiella sediminum TaxID=1247510 RepID=A0A556A7N2_9BURK|nr:NAD/NADP-dependent octopine/nopaline dehydrogenase family protein [Verticiella sediminum]TSH88906.1 NAD/NADP octopine/nopaline dehydrogenase [Verticiella sediminum]
MSAASSGTEPRIVVVGAGAIGCATAIHLQAAGHAPMLWSASGRRFGPSPARVALQVRGGRPRAAHLDLTTDAAAVHAADIIIVCLPGDAYAPVLGRLAPHWRDGQRVIVSGALSLSPLWLHEQARRRGQRIAAIGWATTATTAHFLADGSLHMNPLRERIDVAAAGTDPQTAQTLCASLLGDRFVAADNLLAITLANINPIAHAAEVLPNLSRMDLGERWPLFGCFTGVVARLAERLDEERLALACAFGFALPTLAQHYARSYGLAPDALERMAAGIEARGMGPLGPSRLAHRYVLEDVPYGMVFQEALARSAGVPSPVLSSCIELLSACYTRDFRAEAWLVRELGVDGADAGALYKRCAASRSAVSPR